MHRSDRELTDRLSPRVLLSVLLPQYLSSPSWSNLAAPCPSVISVFHLLRREQGEGGGRFLPSFVSFVFLRAQPKFAFTGGTPWWSNG